MVSLMPFFSLFIYFGMVTAAFRDSRSKVRTTIFCNIAENLKVDCGYSGITSDECANRGCCYSPTSYGSSSPACFLPGSDYPTLYPTLSPTESPSLSSQPTQIPTTLKPSYSLSPTRAPTHPPTHPNNTLVVAFVIVGILILFALIFLGISYARTWGKKRKEEAEVKEKAVAENHKDDTHQSEEGEDEEESYEEKELDTFTALSFRPGRVNDDLADSSSSRHRSNLYDTKRISTASTADDGDHMSYMTLSMNSRDGMDDFSLQPEQRAFYLRDPTESEDEREELENDMRLSRVMTGRWHETGDHGFAI